MERSDSAVTYVEVRRSLIPLTWDNAVRTVGLDECEAAGRSLAHAFAADSLSHYLLDGEDLDAYSDEQKWKLHVVLMNTVVTSHILGGCVTTIGPDHDALAVWFVSPPFLTSECRLALAATAASSQLRPSKAVC